MGFVMARPRKALGLAVYVTFLVQPLWKKGLANGEFLQFWSSFLSPLVSGPTQTSCNWNSVANDRKNAILQESHKHTRGKLDVSSRLVLLASKSKLIWSRREMQALKAPTDNGHPVNSEKWRWRWWDPVYRLMFIHEGRGCTQMHYWGNPQNFFVGKRLTTVFPTSLSTNKYRFYIEGRIWKRGSRTSRLPIWVDAKYVR